MRRALGAAAPRRVEGCPEALLGEKKETGCRTELHARSVLEERLGGKVQGAPMGGGPEQSPQPDFFFLAPKASSGAAAAWKGGASGGGACCAHPCCCFCGCDCGGLCCGAFSL